MKIFTRIPFWRGLRRALGILTLSLIAASAALSQPPITGKIDKAWVEPGTMRTQGFKLEKLPATIHVKFNVNDAPGISFILQARFYSEDGTPITAPANSPNKTADGNLAVTLQLTSTSIRSNYPSMKLSIPIRELNSKENREKKIKFFVILLVNSRQLAKSDWVSLPSVFLKDL